MWRMLNGIWQQKPWQPNWKKGQNICGVFTLNPDTSNEIRVQNTIVEDGADKILRSLFRAESTLPAAFYMGLTSASYAFDDADLTDIEADEPVGNGYARQTLTRNTSDWGVPTLENSAMRITSKSVTFTASSAWNVPWTRMFLANVASGAGNCFALSGALSPQTVLAGAGPTLRYEWWCRA
jgi:hypothetical protein